MKNADMPAMPLALDIRVDESGNSEVNDCYQGLTKREMFAMNSPSEIPEWFSNNFNADISSIEKPELSEHQVEMMNEYNNDNYGLSDEDFKTGSDASSINYEYQHKCDLEREKQMYFAWKSYHADELLKELDK